MALIEGRTSGSRAAAWRSPRWRGGRARRGVGDLLLEEDFQRGFADFLGLGQFLNPVEGCELPRLLGYEPTEVCAPMRGSENYIGRSAIGI